MVCRVFVTCTHPDGGAADTLCLRGHRWPTIRLVHGPRAAAETRELLVGVTLVHAPLRRDEAAGQGCDASICAEQRVDLACVRVVA